METQLASSNATFLLKRWFFYRARKTPKSGNGYGEHLDALRRDGIAFVPDFVSAIAADAIRRDIEGADQAHSSDIDTRYSAMLVKNLDEVSETAKEFFEHPLLSTVAAAAVGIDAYPVRRTGRVESEVGRARPTDMHHFDEWRPKLKFFLYVEDVGEEQAPLVYLRGSHRFRAWRIDKEREYYDYHRVDNDGNYVNDEADFCGHVLLPQVRALKERYGYEEVVCTAKKGTLIAFDSRGLHRSTPLESGRRTVASVTYVLPSEVG